MLDTISREWSLFSYLQTMAGMAQPSRLLEGRFSGYFKPVVKQERSTIMGRDAKFFSVLAKEVLTREIAPAALMEDAMLAAEVIHQLTTVLEHRKEADLQALGLKLLKQYFRIRLHFHPDGRIEIERFPDEEGTSPVSSPFPQRHRENSAA